MLDESYADDSLESCDNHHALSPFLLDKSQEIRRTTHKDQVWREQVSKLRTDLFNANYYFLV
jgi:hypothetical protein